MKKVLSSMAIGAFILCGASTASALTVGEPTIFAAEVGAVNAEYTMSAAFKTAITLKENTKYIFKITLPAGYIIKATEAVTNFGDTLITERSAVGRNYIEMEVDMGADQTYPPGQEITIKLTVADTKGALKQPGVSVPVSIAINDTISIVQSTDLDAGTGTIAKSQLKYNLKIESGIVTVDVKSTPAMTAFAEDTVLSTTEALTGRLEVTENTVMDLDGEVYAPDATDRWQITVKPSSSTFPALAETNPLYFDANGGGFTDGEEMTVSEDKTSAQIKLAPTDFSNHSWGIFGYKINGESKLPVYAQFDMTIEYLVKGSDSVKFLMAKGPVSEWNFNGTALQAPIFQMPEGWLCRTTLTTTAGAAVKFSAETLSEDGSIISMAATEGEIPESGTMINMCEDWIQGVSGGAKRGSMLFYVEESPEFINGTYQIVNPVSGSISNQTMIKNEPRNPY